MKELSPASDKMTPSPPRSPDDIIRYLPISSLCILSSEQFPHPCPLMLLLRNVCWMGTIVHMPPHLGFELNLWGRNEGKEYSSSWRSRSQCVTKPFKIRLSARESVRAWEGWVSFSDVSMCCTVLMFQAHTTLMFLLGMGCQA